MQPSMVVRMMKTRHLQLVPDSGKERRSLAGKTSIEETEVVDKMIDLVLLEVERRRNT